MWGDCPREKKPMTNGKPITTDQAHAEPKRSRLFPERPTLADIRAQLMQPFPVEAIECKPTATNERDGKMSALAAPYVDARIYQARLDDAAGPDNWSVEYRPINDRATLCRLTVCGVAREDVGEADAADPNQATSAAMQSFKRACAAFGLGRYLYTDLPKLWVDAEKRGKNAVITDPIGAAREMYRRAGIVTDKRAVYIERIRQMLIPMAEADLVTIGKFVKGDTDDKPGVVSKTATLPV
jgi:hypothetical protein